MKSIKHNFKEVLYMKKRLIKLLTITCVTLMLAGMMTGCRENATPASEPTEATENTENNINEETTEEIISEGTEATEIPTDTTETEISEEPDEYSTEVTLTGDVNQDFTQTLSDINAIQAGSAGSSLRSEKAFSSFTSFIKAYGADNSKETITKMTKEWLDAQKDDDSYIYDNFMENYDSMLCLTEDLDSEFKGSDAYKNVTDGILAAL